MVKKIKPLVAGALAISLVSGGVGVYAGTVIDSYKSPRGHIVTVEPVNVHKNRIGITVNGKAIKSTTWYADNVSYVPLREVAELLGASVNYNPSTVSADIVTHSKLLDLLGIKLQVPYLGVQYGDNQANVSLTIKSFNPNTNLFEGSYVEDKKVHSITGRITENKITYKKVTDNDNTYELIYNSNDKTYTGHVYFKGHPWKKIIISLE